MEEEKSTPGGLEDTPPDLEPKTDNLDLQPLVSQEKPSLDEDVNSNAEVELNMDDVSSVIHPHSLLERVEELKVHVKVKDLEMNIEHIEAELIVAREKLKTTLSQLDRLQKYVSSNEIVLH